MLKITSKLKRVKYTRWFFQIVIWVVLSPLFLLHFLGHVSEIIIRFISDRYFRTERKIVKKFKLDEIARAQYASNPEKFNDQQKRKRQRSKNLQIKR